MAKKYEKDVDEIIDAVGKDLDRDEVEKLLKNYVEEFRLSPGEAKKLVARKFGGAMRGSSEAVTKSVKELTVFDRNVDLLCRVVFSADKTITVEGEDKEIISGILGDDSGTVPFTVWEKGEISLRKGDVVRIKNAYVNEWREEIQVNVGDRGTIELADPDELPAFEVKPRAAKTLKVSELGSATGNVSLVARLLTADPREVSVSGETKQVVSGTMADGTGKVSYTCWGRAKLKPGDVIKVNSGYLRRWRGMPQLNFDSTAMEKSKEKLPDEEELARPVDVSVEKLASVGGMVDASVSGVILDVRQGSGLVFRCPECNRVLQKSVCRVHGEVGGIPDLRTKAVLDDGTGALSVILNRELTERLLKKSLDKCMKQAQKAVDHGVIQDELFELLVASPMRISGNATSDDFGLMLIANNAEFLDIDVHDEANRLLEELV